MVSGIYSLTKGPAITSPWTWFKFSMIINSNIPRGHLKLLKTYLLNVPPGFTAQNIVLIFVSPFSSQIPTKHLEFSHGLLVTQNPSLSFCYLIATNSDLRIFSKHTIPFHLSRFLFYAHLLTGLISGR